MAGGLLGDSVRDMEDVKGEVVSKMESLAEYCKQAMKEIDDTIADIFERQIDIEHKFLCNQDKTRQVCKDILEEIQIYIED